MALPKLYDPITWHNNTTPALNEDNLNAMSQAIDDIDDRVIDLAGTIMEDVPQIIEDMEILEPAIENIDENVARAESAAESAEQYAEEIAPPIEVVKDFAPIITLEDAINKPVKDLKVKVDAVQDLHGYTKPWVGGAGKQKIQLTVSAIKSANTDGTWSGNVYTHNSGVTYTIQTDSDNNVTGIKANGTAGSAHLFLLGSVVAPAGSYILSGNPSGGSYATRQLQLLDGSSTLVAADNGDSASFTLSDAISGTARLRLAAGTYSNVIFEPMVCLSTASNPTTFEPYTNICPITGHSEAKVTRAGKNLAYLEQGTIDLNNGNETSSSTRVRTDFIPIKQGVTYVDSSQNNGWHIRNGAAYDENKQIIVGAYYYPINHILTINDPRVKYIRLIYSHYVTTENCTPNDFWYQLEVGNTATEYAPFVALDTFTIDLDGTRYGGVLDVDEGTLTLTHKIVDMGTLSWQYTGSPSNRFYAILYDDTYNMKHNSASELSDSICSNYPQVTRADFYLDGAHDFSYSISESSSTACALNVRDSNYTQSSDFSTAMSGVQLCYALKVPQTITLTAEEVTLLLGYNTLFADTGDIALTYDASGVLRIANAKLDIDTFKSIVAASSDFADFKSRVAAL